MSKINVLVTGIGGGSHGEQILKALRFSKELDLFIIGTDTNDHTPSKDLVSLFYKVPYANEPEYDSVIFGLLEKHNIQFMFHGSEPELNYMSVNRGRLEKKNIMHPLNSTELIKLCMNKCDTYKRLEDLRIDIPSYWKINQITDIDKVNRFPVVLKPSTSSGGSSHVYIAVDSEELFLLASYMLKRDIDMVVQEYVGSSQEEYTIGVNSDSSGNVLGSIVVKREITNALTTRLKIRSQDRSYVISSGVSQGVVCHYPLLQTQAENIAYKLESKGPLNIQCRMVNNKLMLMEINPRLSGTTSLRAMAGYNEPEMMIKFYLHKQKWKNDYVDLRILRTLKEVVIE